MKVQGRKSTETEEIAIVAMFVLAAIQKLFCITMMLFGLHKWPLYVIARWLLKFVIQCENVRGIIIGSMFGTSPTGGYIQIDTH